MYSTFPAHKYWAPISISQSNIPLLFDHPFLSIYASLYAQTTDVQRHAYSKIVVFPKDLHWVKSSGSLLLNTAMNHCPFSVCGISFMKGNLRTE